MIVTNKFIWFHFGKTGGNMFHYLMNTYYKNEIVFQHDVSDPEKHLRPCEVPQEYSRIKNYVIGFRRLSSWLISHNRHHNICYDPPETIHLPVEEVIEATKKGKMIMRGEVTDHKPDEMMVNYEIPSNNFEFIRQESLLSDFFILTSKYFEANKSILNDTSVIHKNNTKQHVVLDEKDNAYLYKLNPLWAEKEHGLYSRTEQGAFTK